MDVPAEVRFKRYLHYASEDGIYIPGNRFYHKNYTPEKVPSFHELISEKKEDVILNSIKKVHLEKTSAYTEALIYALALCVKHRDNPPNLRIGAYKLAEMICTTSEYLFVFFKFTFEFNPRSGTGRACRRLVKNWYLKKTGLQLAEMVAQRPKHKGWCHADIVSVAHIKSEDKAQAAVLKFIVRGLEEAKKDFSNEPAAHEVLSYLSNVSDFRKVKDPHTAARKIESYMLSIEHVNVAIIKEKEVWKALVRIMPLPVLMNHLQWLGKNGMYRSGPAWDYDFVKVICDALNNPASITDSEIHPSRAFIELCTYKNAARMKIELAVKLAGKPAKQAPAINQDLIKALEKVIRSSFKSIESSGLTYAIGVDINETMSRRCGYCKYVTAFQAASLITLCFLKTEKNVDVLPFTAPPLQPISIPVEYTVEETQIQLQQQVGRGPIDIESLFKWARESKKKIDVFIILSSYVKQSYVPHEKYTGNTKPVPIILEEMRKYSEAANMPNARAILCNLSGTPRQQGCIEKSNIFTVSGFDEKVCKLIEGFAKGAF